MNIVKERANAKINLYLDVLSRTDDGFHTIKTVMHSVSLYDTVSVKLISQKERRIKLFVKNNKYLPIDSKNLAYRAAEKFLSYANIDSSVEIVLEKKIPIAAGLAGGSSDAAAVLRAMNKLFNKPFTSKMMYKIASELGSDVPYCLYGKSALCEGKGEIMTFLPDVLRLNVVIAISKEHMSTPIAYSELDKRFSNFDGSVKTNAESHFTEIEKSFKDGLFRPSGLYNIFESTVLESCQRAREIKKRLTELGAVSSLMSGSGPSVFGVFESMEKASAARDALTSEGILAFAVSSV